MIASAALALFAAAISRCSTSTATDDAKTEAKVVVRTDTIIVRDTISISHPIAVETRPVATVQTTLPVVTTSTATPTDSATVAIPIEQTHYTADTYDAWVSGYMAQLDSIKIYQTTRTITTTHEVTKYKTKRWGLSIGAGVVATPTKIEPGIFAGITYTFIAF